MHAKILLTRWILLGPCFSPSIRRSLIFLFFGWILHAMVSRMDTLHRHMPQTGVDGMQELREIAIQFEEETFSNSQNQQDYLRKISMKMPSLKTNANNNNNQFPAGANQRPIEHTPVESLSQAGQPVIAERQEKVYQRLQAMKDMYFEELRDLIQKFHHRCQKPMRPDQSEKIKHGKALLQRALNYFNAPKNAIPANCKEGHVEALEKRVQTILTHFNQNHLYSSNLGNNKLKIRWVKDNPCSNNHNLRRVKYHKSRSLSRRFNK